MSETSSAFLAPDLCPEDVSTGITRQSHNNTGALTPNALDHQARDSTRPAERGLYVIALKIIATENEAFTRSPEKNAVQWEEIKLDSNRVLFPNTPTCPL